MSKEEKHIDDIIKDSFNQEAEDFDFGSWNDLEEKLDRDNAIDKTIVSAYDIPEEEVPSSVWSNVNDELDIETVWDRIHLSLENRHNRALWWWNAASVVFFSIFLLLLFDTTFNKNSSDQRYSFKDGLVNIDSVKLDQDINNMRVNNPIAENNVTTHSNDKSTYNSNNKSSLNTKETLRSTNKQLQNTDPDLGSSIDPNISKNRVDPVNTGHLTRATNIDEKQDGSYSVIAQLSPKVTCNLPLDISRSYDSLLFKKPLEQHPHQKHWTLGLTCGILSSNLMDALFRESVSSNSLVTPEFSLAVNPGIYAQYRTKNNWLIQADIYLNYKISRKVSLYEELSYVIRKTDLRYQRLHLYGGKRFLITNSARGSTFFEASLGGFVSYLSDQREYRGNTLVSKEKALSDWNIGLDTEIGIVHSFDRISIAYGAQVNKGLLNVMKDISSKPWNRARTLSTGIYIRMGYQF